MKSYCEPIEVKAIKGRPRSLRWRHRVGQVSAIHDYWVLQTRWWEREEKRCYYLLSTTLGDVEVYRSGNQWILSRLVD